MQILPMPAYSGVSLHVSVVGLNRACRRMTGYDLARQAHALTLTLNYEDLYPCVPIATQPPSPPWVVPLGAFEPGQFTLVLNPVSRTLGPQPSSSMTFQVVPAIAVSTVTVPALGAWTLMTMAGAVAALAALAHRRRCGARSR